MSLTIYNLQTEIKKYEEELKQNKELIQKLIEENERLKNHNNKNSNNSSKLFSTDNVTPKKKTGANLYNYRVKKSEKAIKVLEENFLNGITGYTDETIAKFNYKKIYIRNYSNEENVIYKVQQHKGYNSIKEDNILPFLLRNHGRP